MNNTELAITLGSKETFNELPLQDNIDLYFFMQNNIKELNLLKEDVIKLKKENILHNIHQNINSDLITILSNNPYPKFFDLIFENNMIDLTDEDYSELIDIYIMNLSEHYDYTKYLNILSYLYKLDNKFLKSENIRFYNDVFNALLVEKYIQEKDYVEFIYNFIYDCYIPYFESYKDKLLLSTSISINKDIYLLQRNLFLSRAYNRQLENEYFYDENEDYENIEFFENKTVNKLYLLQKTLVKKFGKENGRKLNKIEIKPEKIFIDGLNDSDIYIYTYDSDFRMLLHEFRENNIYMLDKYKYKFDYYYNEMSMEDNTDRLNYYDSFFESFNYLGESLKKHLLSLIKSIQFNNNKYLFPNPTDNLTVKIYLTDDRVIKIFDKYSIKEQIVNFFAQELFFQNTLLNNVFYKIEKIFAQKNFSKGYNYEKLVSKFSKNQNILNQNDILFDKKLYSEDIIEFLYDKKNDEFLSNNEEGLMKTVCFNSNNTDNELSFNVSEEDSLKAFNTLIDTLELLGCNDIKCIDGALTIHKHKEIKFLKFLYQLEDYSITYYSKDNRGSYHSLITEKDYSQTILPEQYRYAIKQLLREEYNIKL